MTIPSPTTSRRELFKLAGAIGAAAAFAGTLSACGTTPSQRGGDAAANLKTPTIKAAISYELGTNGFDPMTTTAALTVAANWHTMEGLTEILPSGKREVYAALGKELPKKVDDLTYEVALRDGATFHNGAPVTADDVVYSFARVLDPANKSLYAGFLGFLDHVEKKDDKTVTIKLKQPFSLVAERIAVVKIVPKAAATADPKAFDANPVGTGPYRMIDNSATSKQVVFEKFDAYSGPHPAKANSMVWKVMPDDATRMNALTSKAVAAMDLVPDLSIQTLKSSASVESVQGFALLFAMFNCGSAPFNDVKNRQGFLWALDMANIVKTAYLGNATPSTSFLQETHPNFHQAKTVYTLDLAKAKALFAETGLKSIRLLCTDHAWVQKATPIIKSNLEAAGLTVDFTQKKSADVYTTIDADPNAYDAVIAPGDPSVFGPDPDLALRWWYGSDTWTDKRMHWKGQDSYTQMQDLLNKAITQSGSQQQGTWNQVFDLASDVVPMYPLFHRKSTTGWDGNTLTGFEPIALTGLSFLDVTSK